MYSFSRFTPIFLLLSVCSFVKVLGQSDAIPLNQVISPSPEVGSIVKVADVPVNYYTGKPQLSLPIFTIKSGVLKHNISIGYNSFGGIQVDQQATMVGLGWDLSVGGAIARTAIGKPDETSASQGYQGAATTLGLPLYTDANPTNFLNTLDNCELKNLAEGRQDLTPDIYYINFDSQSAKMFFDKTGQPFLSPYKPWKIAGNNSSSFIITIENGTRYEFSKIESTINDIETIPGDGGSAYNCNTGWFLTRIVSPTLKDTIQFNYTASNYYSEGVVPSQTRQDLVPGQSPGCNGQTGDLYRESLTMNSQTINGWLLSSITYGSGKVEFVMNQDRRDINTGNKYRIRELNFYSLKGTSNYTFIKKIRLFQSYSNPSSSDSLSRRLLLDSISEVSGGDSLVHRFAYINPNSLPKRSSYSQDHWGYFNGRSNSTLIPAYDDGVGTSYSGANREVDSVSSQVGLLSSITYPTGGSTSFEYELNDYTYYRSQSIYSPAHTDSSRIQKSGHVNTNTLSTPNGEVTDTVYVPSNVPNQSIVLQYIVTGKIYGDAQADVWVTNESGTVVFSAGDTHGTSMTTTSSLPPGHTYVIHAERTGTTERAAIILFYFDWNYFYVGPLYLKNAGGCRIKRITQYDGLSHSNDIVKRFKYNLNDSLSSGVLLDLPRYSDLTFSPYYCSTPPTKGGDFVYLTRQANSMTTLGRTQGSPIGYSKVTVLNGENGEDGYEEYYHSINGLMDSGGDGYPYIPRTSRDDLRGLLLQHRIYNSNRKVVKATLNEYNFNNTPGNPNFKWIWGVKYGTIRVSNTNDANGCPSTSQWSFIGGMYQVIQFWPVLTKTTDSLFDIANNTFLTTSHSYSYDTVNTQVSRDDFTTSNGSQLSTVFVYPNNLTGAVYDSMKARNIISEVITKTVFRNATQISKDSTSFGFYSGLLVPLSKQLSFSSSLPETRLQFYSYDTKGNLLEQSKSNDVHEVYLWGYNSQYPVARIVGSTYAAIGGLVNSSILQNPASDSALRTELNRVRVALAGSLGEVFTYTFSPGCGVTSETNPQGITTYYEYDGLGRLKCIKDTNGKIVKLIDYRYRVSMNQ